MEPINGHKPRIICVSADNDEYFRWYSDGWNSHTKGTFGTPGAHRLMVKAADAIESGKDVLDTIKRLERAGFEVERA